LFVCLFVPYGGGVINVLERKKGKEIPYH